MIIFHVFRKQNSCPPPLLDLSPYIRISLLPSPLLDRHRDEKRVTVSPLESAFTNRDTCNPFRIRFYKAIIPPGQVWGNGARISHISIREMVGVAFPPLAPKGYLAVIRGYFDESY